MVIEQLSSLSPCQQILSVQACSASASSGMGSKGSSFCRGQNVPPSWHKTSELHALHKLFMMLLGTRLLSSLLFQHWLQQSLTLMELCPPYKGLSYLHYFVNSGAAKTAELYLVNIDCYCSAPSFIHGKKPCCFFLS